MYDYLLEDLPQVIFSFLAGAGTGMLILYLWDWWHKE